MSAVVTEAELPALVVGMTVLGEKEDDSIPEVAALGAELEDCVEA